MFASDEAGRAVARGVAISVLVHSVVAWTLAEYASVGVVPGYELRVQGLSDTVPEVTGRFAQPSGTFLSPSDGADQVGSNGAVTRSGALNSRKVANSEAVQNSPDRGALDGPEKSSDRGALDGPEESSDREVPPDDFSDRAPPEREQTESGRVNDSTSSSTTVSDEEEVAEKTDAVETSPAENSKSGESRRPPGMRPTFPSVEGNGNGGEGGSGAGGDRRGGISLAAIRRIIRSKRHEILECYASRHDYVAAGKKAVVVEFKIGTDGNPADVRAVHRTTNSRVADCVTRRMGEWKFPELSETVRLVKRYTIDARIRAKWVHPRSSDPLE